MKTNASVFNRLAKHFGFQFRKETQTWREAITESNSPEATYAIGDVHGRYDLLKKAEEAILKDNAVANSAKLIIMLGDVVDRGSQSAQVIDHLIATSQGGPQRICLLGNHEAMMLHFLHNPDHRALWLRVGGYETLRSYGIPDHEIDPTSGNRQRLQRVLQSYIPEEHMQFLRSLPLLYQNEKQLFVHAGLKLPSVMVNRLRDDSFDLKFEALADLATYSNRLVVHGHHIRETAQQTGQCLNLDTGAYISGRLTYARFMLAEHYTLHEITTQN